MGVPTARNPETVTIRANGDLSLQEWVKVARNGAHISVEPAILERLMGARQVIDDHSMENSPPVYGLTTGLGQGKDTRIPVEMLAEYNSSIIREHTASVGERLPADVVRGTMFARLVGLARGGSGISLETFEAYRSFLNASITPVVPSLGSVGEADLGQLAHIANTLLGRGDVMYQGTEILASEALSLAGLLPPMLKPRDGLALIGANSYTAAVAALAVWDVNHFLHWGRNVIALSWAAFRANQSPLLSYVIQERGEHTAHYGDQLLELLQGTEYNPRSIQDPLSFRCVPQVMGTLHQWAGNTEATILAEISHAMDNPFVDTERKTTYSNGNFDATDLAVHLDALRNVLFRSMVMLERRAEKLLNPRFSGLTMGLADQQGHAGIGVLHHTLLSLLGEAQLLAQPVYVQIGAAAEGVEDFGSMVTQSALYLRKMVDVWRWMIAIEYTVARRALQLAKVPLGVRLQRVADAANQHLTERATPSEAVTKLYDLLGGDAPNSDC